MNVLVMLSMVIGASLRVGQCLVRFKWPVLALLIVAPLAITWSLEVFALNGLGIFFWFGGGARQLHKAHRQEGKRLRKTNKTRKGVRYDNASDNDERWGGECQA